MKNHLFIWVARRMKRRIPAILLMLAAQVANALGMVYFALGSREVIDSAIAGNRQAFFRACGIQAGIVVGIVLSMALLRHLRERLRADLERDWKQRLLHGLLHGDYAAVSAYHSGELLNRLNNDVSRVNESVLTILPNAVAMVTRLVAAVTVLGILDGRLTLVVLAFGAVALTATGLVRRRLKELNKQVSALDGQVSGFMQETIEKLLMVQAMDVAQEMEQRSNDLMGRRYGLQRKRKNLSVLTNTCINLLYHGAGFLALAWCAWQMLLGNMSFGSLTAVTHLVSQLQAPFVNLSGVLPQYVAAVASAERVMELEEIQGEPSAMKEDPAVLYGRMDKITGADLTFAYDREPVLSGAEFCLPKGGFAAITGPSGVGKSTLLKLLLGVFRPEQGSLYLECGAERVPLDRSTRRLFAYVPQGNLLLSGTLRDNLTITCPDADEEAIRQALYVSCMEDFLPQLPQGLDTVLGESGAGLSEGQAQRLAIARAVLGGAPVLLLDECTSALDADTEKRVLERIRALPNRTVIAVTHRPAALYLCDRQLRLENGNILVLSREKEESLQNC